MPIVQRYLVIFLLTLLASAKAMAAGEIEISFTPTLDATYENGEVITYSIEVRNTTISTISDVTVTNAIWDVMSGSNKAFSSINITDTHTLGTNAGTYSSSNSNLNVTGANLLPLGRITYQIEATVADDAAENIVLGNTEVKGTVSGTETTFTNSTTITFTPAEYDYILEASVSPSEYNVGGTLTYSLKATNNGSYAVKGLDIEQNFASLTGQKIDGSTGDAFSNVSISAVASSGSKAGTFATTGDLSVVDAEISVGGYITYTVEATVAADLVSDIDTQASSTTRAGTVDSNALSTPPADPDVELEHTLNSTSPYLINGEVNFELKVSNNGGAIAHNYHVKQNIKDLVSRNGLANDLSPSYNNTDVDGNPFSTWDITVSSIGSNSLSDYQGSSKTDVDFDDTVSIYPRESITYQIKATLTPITIGTLQGFTASVTDESGSLVESASISDTVDAEKVLSVTDSDISISKTTSASEYVPGGEIEYEITVTNGSSKYFANNLLVQDNLTCVMTEQAGGAGEGQAFEEWKVEVISGEDSIGSDPGSFGYGSWSSSPISLTPDIAPGKTIKYKLTAKTNDTSTGLILDDDPSCSNDNVTEEGSGVQTPDDNLRASKDVDSRFYSSGQTLTYTITVTNDGDGFANQVQVLDDLNSVKTTDINGKEINAYSDWTITAEAFKDDGTPATASNTGIAGEVKYPDNLNVIATLQPHSYIEYTIVADTNPLANGHISNEVTVDGSVYADRGSDPRDFAIELNKRVKTNTDSGFHDEQTAYSKLDTEVTYQISLKNAKENGYATNVAVKDTLSSISASILEPDTTSKQVFTSWTISAEIISDDPQLDGNPAYTDVGTFASNTDLDTTAQIPPNVEVVYTIVAQIDRSNESEIIYSRFDNTVEIKTPDSTVQSSASDTVIVYPHDPKVIVAKTTPDDEFIPGQWVNFKVTIVNTGAGYANEVRVTDDIIGLNAFSEWEITSTTDSNDTPFKTGSYAGSKSNYPDNGNINTRIDIDPKVNGVEGYVVYNIRGKVKDDYVEDEISNTAEIYDPSTNLNQSSSAEIGGTSSEKLNVSILKTADKVRFVPGDDVTYEIRVLNNGANIETGLKVVDLLTDIRAVLANDKDNQYENYPDQPPFKYWQFDYDDGAGFQSQTKDDFIYPPGDASNTMTLAPGELRTFKIKARVEDNVVGSQDSMGNLNDKIENDAYVYRDFGSVTEESHLSHHEMERAYNGGDVVRKLLVNGVESRFYSPGDTLTYQVTVSSQTGYVNDHGVNENITGVTTQLLDGSLATPFDAGFTVDVSKDDANGGDGTTDGTLDGTVEDNKDILTTIDVAGGDSVTFEVEGVVREDATGTITIGGITVIPNSYHLSFSKTVDQSSYEPGQPLVYRLTIENDGNGNAYNIPVIDRLSTIDVELVDGTTDQAFDAGWTVVPSIVSGSSEAIFDLDGTIADNADIDTHASIPAGTKIEYKVTAKVNDNAVGNILNLLTVDGDTVSAETKASAEKYDFSKHVVKLYDQDGSTELTGGYTPGGYIEYEISLKNLNNVHINQMPIKDEISSIQTDYFVGGKGRAFDSWTIVSSVDTSGISNAGSVSNNRDIDTKFDLAASGFATGGTFVTYTIKAKISEQAVGQILNVAVVDNSHNLPSEPVNMLPANISKTHKAYTDTTLATHKTTYNHTTDGEKIVYHLRVENNGKGLEYNKSLQELFSKVKVRVAQNAAGESDSQTLPAFDQYGWTVTVTTSGEATTLIDGYTGGPSSDIDISTLSIAPGGWIDFVMESQIRQDALDQIVVKPKYNGSNFSSAKVTPDNSNLSVSKEIVSIDGKSYVSGDTYKPEDEVIYKFTVTNTEPVWRDQTVIQDIVSNVRVEVIGGTTKSAFSETNISHVFTSTGTTGTQDTYIESYDATDDLDLLVDIAPEEVIEFSVKGKIRPDALGDIDGNTGKAGNQSDTTDVIPPVVPVLSFSKQVFNTTSDTNICTFPSDDGVGCHYNPSGQVQYRITVKNEGESIANDVAIIDKLNEIYTEAVTPTLAFSDYSSAIVSAPDASRFSIAGQYEGNVPLDATFDLMPGDEVVFELNGTVAFDALDDIVNVASINGVNTNEVRLEQGDSDIIAQKSTSTPTYKPGSTVKYEILIRNETTSNQIVAVEDLIGSYTVETADGTQQPALDSWTINAEILSDGNGATNIDELDALEGTSSPTISNNIELGAKTGDVYSLVQIQIEGVVRNDAVGKFTNNVSVDTKTYNLREKFIYPQPGELEVSKVTTSPTAIYHPGDTIGYDIEVKNIGDGYATDVLISDLWKTIRAEKAGASLPVRAFDSWSSAQVVSVEGTDPDLSKPISGSEVTGDSGYQIRYNIHPDHTVKLHVEGVVKDDLVGDITNVVEVSDSSGIQSANATYVAATADLTVEKTVDKSQYESGDTLTYTIKIENTTANWASDVAIKDLVNDIIATSITGTNVKAFETGTIFFNASSQTGETKLPSSTGEFLDGNLDIGPNDIVTITVEAELDPEVVGEVINQVEVTYNGTTKTAEATSTAKIPDLTFTKEPMVEFYSPNQAAGYILKIVNEGNSYANDINLKDEIGTLTVTTIDGSTNQAFLQWAVQYVKGSSLTTVDANSLVVDKDIDYNIDLAPNDTITLYVIGLVNAEATGDIVNQAILNHNSKDVTATATLKPRPGDIVLEKTTDERYYQPGEFSTFRVKVTNNGSGFAADVKVEDIISSLEVETSGGAMEPAFNDWTIVTTKGDPRTNIDTTPGPNGDISTNLDIAPGDTVEFAITGTVNSSAVANIVNTATVEFGGATSDATATLETLPEEVWIEKTAESPIYIPGEEAVFHVRVYNGTDGFDNDIELDDILSGIKATNIYGVNERAFESWTIETTNSDSRTTITPMPVDNQDIRSVIDIAPHDIVEFTITVKTNPLAASEITNTAIADLNGTMQQSSATIQPQSQGISIEKTADTEYYVPGTEATFRVKVKNEGTVSATGVDVKDIISDLKVVRLDGTTVEAFDSWRIDVNKSNPETDITNIPGVNADIDSTLTIAANDEVEFVITGLVNQYATGEIKNTASATFRGDTQEAAATLLAMPESVKLEKTVDDEFYRPGENVTYHVVLSNDSGSFTEEIVLKDLVSELKVNTINDTEATAFTSWSMTSSYSDERTIVLPQIQGDNIDVNSRVILAPNDTLEIEITGVVNSDAMGEITNHAYAYDKSESDVLVDDFATIKPLPIILSVTKVADKAEYTNDDDEITFTMTATNRGSADAESVNLLDEIDTLIGNNGNALFTTWKATITELKSGVVVSVDSDSNVDSNHTMKAYQGNEYEIVVTGEINQGIDDNFTNVFTAAASTGETASANVTIKVKKQAYNEGMLTVTKVASKSEASVGEVVEYEVTITNENDNPFTGVRLVDRYPGGFAYIPDSTEMLNSGPDGVFDTSDDVQITVEPTKTNQLFFEVGDMNIYGKGDSKTADAIRIRYLMRVSVGATFGVYTNTAWAEAPPAESFSAQNTTTNYVVKSNLASATVEVMPDKVFDTASIIGKVFEDHNGDGFQADATADDIYIDVDLAEGDYIPNSTFITQDGVETQLKDEKVKRKGQEVVMSSVDKGYEVDELYGLSRNRTLEHSNKVAFQFKTRTRQGFPFKVTTDNGTHIEFDKQDYLFESNTQLLFRLKAFDKDGNMDVTTVGVIDLVEPDSEVDIDKNDGEEEQSRKLGKAQLMRHNIPTSAGLARFIGTGLKGVDKVIIGEDEFDVEEGELYAEQYLPADAYLFPTRVVFDNGEERRYQLYVRIPDEYWVQAGLADFYIGKNKVTGNSAALAVDDQYQDDIYNQGRLAYFGQGKFGDKLRVTTHFDTKESDVRDMFKHPFASDSSSVFDILEDDDEMYYGNYGDSSNIYKVVNTKGKVYLNVEYDKSNVLWGNYNTGITGTDNNDYNRSLYGFKGDYRTRSTTKFGEDRLNIVGFVAESDSLFAHDEFLGTGGSLYFLRHGEVVPGSDKVMVKVVDPDSSITVQEMPLQSGRDYEIDPYQGRIILTRPLNNIISDNFGSVINDQPSSGYDNYLSVDYEYVPQGSDALDAMTAGGRVKGWVNDYIGVGANYQTEEKDSQDYEAYGTDLTLRASEGTYLKAEFGHSKGRQTDSNYVSFDGGLTFTPIGSIAEDREGDIYQVKGVMNLYDLAPNVFSAVGNDVKAWYKSKDAGYSFASQDDDLEQESYGTEIRFQATDRVAVKTRFTSIEERELDGDLRTDTQQAELETQVKVTKHIKISAAGKQVEELNNEDEKGKGTLAGLRADYIWDSDNNVYIKGQKTVGQTDEYDENDSVTLGGETRILEDFVVGAEYTTGDRGDAAEASVTYDVTEDYSTYLTYVDDTYEGKNNVIVGQRADLTSTVDFYQENQFVDENNGKGRIDSFGFGYDMNDDIDMGIGYQKGEIEDDQKITTERQAVSVSTSIDLDDVVFKNKVEYRVDKTDDATDPDKKRVDQWVTTNRYTHHLTEEYTLFGKFNYSLSESKSSDKVLARFIESTAGLAYRPIYNDRLNLLSRYTYLVDFDQLNRDVDYKDEESHIIEVEGIYSLDANWDLGAKYAFKNKSEIFTRQSGEDIPVDSKISLYGLSASYRVMKDWDVTGEYHWKTDSTYDELEQGALVSVNKHLSDNFKVGVGYNFSGFDGNLANDDDYDASGVFINLVGKL